MAAETVTIKVYYDTRTKLRIISAIKGESHLDAVARLIHNEFKKVNASQQKGASKLIKKYSK